MSIRKPEGIVFRMASAAAVAAAVTGLATARTTSDDNAGASSPPTSSAATTAPSGGSEVATDEAQADMDKLPLSTDEISDWAANALPGPVQQGGW